MAENKDQILADFQSITDIDNVAEAFYYLEESNWDLVSAIQRVMPQDAAGMNAARKPQYNASTSNSNYNRWDSGDLETVFNSGPSTSADANIIDLTSDIELNPRKKEKTLTFNIHYNHEMYPIHISSLATVGDLKERIHTLTAVPFCRQAIRGWPPAKLQEAQIQSTVLDTLDLESENELILIDMTEDGYMDDESNDEIAKRFQETFVLNIVQQPEGKTIEIKFPGTHTIQQVKNDLYSVTNIQVRHQDWTGWPPGSTNSTTLAQSGIELQHKLVLRSLADKAKNSKPGKSNNIVNIDSDSSADEFEDASDFNPDDDYFSETPAQPRLKHLIADQTDDETLGSIQFVENYIRRYGEPHPLFFQGSLEDALKEACHKPAKDRKLLAIYLHHDDSVLTNVFCDQLLRCESVMQTLLQNFILYGWDLTHESNKNLFLSSISACVGVNASMSVRNIHVDRLPAIIVIAKNRSTCDVISVINGNVSVDDLLSRLMETVELYSDQLRIEIREENERAAREQVKYEQDMAYQETLEADQAKEAAKQQKEMALAAERKRLESEKAEQQAIKEANRQEAERALPPEPITEGDGITKIRVRKPTGEFLERKFLINSPLRDLLNFVASRGFPIEEYKVISSWPRKDLTTISTGATLESLKLFPQETVILEER